MQDKFEKQRQKRRIFQLKLISNDEDATSGKINEQDFKNLLGEESEK